MLYYILYIYIPASAREVGQCPGKDTLWIVFPKTNYYLDIAETVLYIANLPQRAVVEDVTVWGIDKQINPL